MDRDEILRHVKELDWKMPAETQNRAIDALSRVDEEHIDLIFDKWAKSTWENAVKVIEKIGYPRNAKLLPVLVMLFQDVNWPGVDGAERILLSLDRKVVIPLVEDALHRADADNDDMWIGALKRFIKKAGYGIEEFNDKKTFEIFKKADF